MKIKYLIARKRSFLPYDDICVCVINIATNIFTGGKNRLMSKDRKKLANIVVKYNFRWYTILKLAYTINK